MLPVKSSACRLTYNTFSQTFSHERRGKWKLTILHTNLFWLLSADSIASFMLNKFGPRKHGILRWNFTNNPIHCLDITTSGLGDVHFHFRLVISHGQCRRHVHWTRRPRKYGRRHWNTVDIYIGFRVISTSGFQSISGGRSIMWCRHTYHWTDRPRKHGYRRWNYGDRSLLTQVNA